ncbi:tryptophan 2,3- dioxygenase [Coemansia guatemalensis]|uniref:Tryptophan 2,3- dioxygenase n=1 Tax=Coemansia guatemalensis TaxID=2761395 RepID=A0A9W8HSI6_9FUNG|nr:tryptophan 2,3- dioxygenase [Coemansia guatemalensis]
MSYTPLRLEDYDISPTHGFLPSKPPLRRLPDPYYTPWEQIMERFNQFVLAHQIRRLVRKALLLSQTLERVAIGKTSQADRPFPNFNLGTIHTFSGSTDESWFYLVTTAIEAKCARGLNAIIAAVEAVEHNDIERVTYSLQQMALSLIDANFILERMYERCDPYVFYWKIRAFLAGWENMAEAGLPYGVLYEGVDDTDKFSLDNWQSLIRRFRKYAGGSAAQTPLLQAFDIALGIKHYPTGEKGQQTSVADARNRLRNHGVPEPPVANSYLVQMRNYMPGGHRRFLEDLAGACRVREYVLLTCSDSLLLLGRSDDPRVLLRRAYNDCVDLMKSFRDKHIMIVSRYIIAPAKSGPSIPQRVSVAAPSRAVPPAPENRVPVNYASRRMLGGRAGGDSLPADPTMYPQTNTSAIRPTEVQVTKSLNWDLPNMNRSKTTSPEPVAGHGSKSGLARQLDGNAIARGTGGTDAMQFLKQVRNETAHTKI